MVIRVKLKERTMKRYIKPNTEFFKAELTALLAGSNPGIDPDDSTTPDASDSKGFSIFGDDYDSDPTPQTFNVWED